MRVIVFSSDWSRLRLDDEVRYARALAAFYCGYGINKVKSLLDGAESSEWSQIIDTAILLGLDETDCLIEG